MKKRLLILAFAFLLLFVMPSCEEDDEAANVPEEPIEVCEHQSGDWIISAEPDCVTPGTRYAECIYCGEVLETETILATGHSFKDGQCSTCGKKYNMDLEFISYNNGTCYVAGKGECTDTDIVIPPESSSGDKVVAIGDSAFQGSDITSVEIGDNVTDIYNCAFDDSRALKTVIIGDRVENIGEYVFRDCFSLASVSVGKNVSSIGYQAFYACNKLTCIDLPAALCDIGVAAFEKCSNLSQVVIASGNAPLKIRDNAFAECIELSEIIIPDNAISLGNCAFDGCIRLKYAYVGNGISMIPEYAFRECRSLEEIVIGSGVESIEYEAFYNCRSMISIQIPESVKAVKPSAFLYCVNLEKISFDKNSSLETIGESAFASCEKLKGIELPDSLTRLNNCAFDNCTSLEYVVIGNNLREVPEYAFRDCHALTSVTFGKSVAKIGFEAFYNCRSLQKVHLSYGIAEIESRAFGDCVSLDQLVFSSTVDKVAYSAFDGCDILRRVYFEGNQRQWENIDFGGNTHFAFDTPFYYQEKYISGDAYYYDNNGDAKIWYPNPDSFYTEEYRLDFLEICGDDVLGHELVNILWGKFHDRITEWEAGKIISDPTYIFDPNDGYLSKKNLYKAVLFDLMLGKDNEMGAISIVEDTSVGLMKDIAKAWDAEWYNEDVIEGFELEKIKELFKVKSIADVELELQDIMAKDYLDEFSFIASCVGNAYEAALAFSRYYALQQLKSGYIDILRDISESGAFPWDMREAAEELILAYEYAFDHMCDDAVLKYQISIFLHESLEDLDESLREKAFNSIVKLDKTGFFATIQYTGKAVVLILDLWNIDKIAETYYKLEGIVYIEQVLHAYIEALPDCDYLKQANRDNAVMFMNAVELFQKSVILENEYSKDVFIAYRDMPGCWIDGEINELIERIDNSTRTTVSLYKQYDDAVKNRYNRYLAR